MLQDEGEKELRLGGEDGPWAGGLACPKQWAVVGGGGPPAEKGVHVPAVRGQKHGSGSLSAFLREPRPY